MPDNAAGNETRPVPPIRAERKGRGWSVATMAKKLREAADDPQRDVPDLEGIRHNIFRWESGGSGVSERYRLLYCRAFGRTEWELFAIEPPGIPSDDDGEGAEMAYAKTSLRSEKRELRERMRAAGLDYRQIATEFSRVYKLRPRAAWREAYGWSLQETADNINTYRGDTGLDPGGISGMTSAHLCEYEKWPGYGESPTGRRPTPYLLAVLASIYDCQVNDLIDLADRQHLPKPDLLILDTYTRPQTAAASIRQVGPTLLRSADEKPAGETPEYNPAFPDGNRYVVLALPRGSQRIVIDVTDTEAEEPGTATQPVQRLKLVGK
jgi:transcriptional regulator with XRE-family HTH domain